MFKLSNEPLSISSIWSASFKLFADTISKIWWLALVLVLASQLLALGVTPLRQMLPGHQEAAALALVFFGNVLLLSFFSSLILHIIDSKVRTTKIAVVTSMKLVWENYTYIVITSVICMLLSFLGTIALIVPGLFISVMLAFTIPAILFAERKVFSAMRYSMHLVWGNWWRTLLVFAPILGVMYLLGFALITYFQHNLVLLRGLHTALFALLYPLLYAFIFIQYHDLKLRKSR